MEICFITCRIAVILSQGRLKKRHIFIFCFVILALSSLLIVHWFTCAMHTCASAHTHCRKSGDNVHYLSVITFIIYLKYTMIAGLFLGLLHPPFRPKSMMASHSCSVCFNFYFDYVCIRFISFWHSLILFFSG